MCNGLFDQILDGCFFSLISFAILFLLLHLKLSVLGEVQGEYLHGKRCWMLEWTTWGSDGVTIPEGIQELTECGTQCHDLIDKGEIFKYFGLDVLDVFSNLNDLVILWNKDYKILCSVIWNYATNWVCVCHLPLQWFCCSSQQQECCLWKKV